MNCLFQAESSPPSLSNPTRNREICGIRAICGSNGPFPLQSPPIGGPTPETFLRQPGPIRMNPRLRVCHGDLLEQPVEVIVNAWNRNFIPWWLLLPQGVSGAIKKRAGYAPFRELARAGVLPLGGAARRTGLLPRTDGLSRNRTVTRVRLRLVRPQPSPTAVRTTSPAARSGT